MSATRDSITRLIVLTVAIALFVPLVWVLLVLPVLAAFGVSTETGSLIGWLVFLGAGSSVGYILYRDLLANRPSSVDANTTSRHGEDGNE